MPSSSFFLRAGIVAVLASIYAPALYRLLTVAGVFRQAKSSHIDSEVVVIDDTAHCEDLHHHVPSNTIFTACEDSTSTRFGWFPGLTILHDPVNAANSKGSIHTIDPKTFKSKRLKFENFDGPFITHGIDIVEDPSNPQALFIFAVNHLPHPEYLDDFKDKQKKGQAGNLSDVPKARSQIEVFHHILGASTAKHVRSIRHPLIKTPNDIVAYSPTSIYVTNDHYYPDGNMRLLEDIYSGAKWSNIIHVQIQDMNTREATSGLDATVAVTGLHNNNGLGRGALTNEMAIGCAASGTLHIAEVSDEDGQKPSQVNVVESIPLDSTIDNPSFFKDPFATEGNDASGYVLAGLSRAVDLPKTAADPSATEPNLVWLTRPVASTDSTKESSSWNTSLLFEDDGSRIRSASAAVLVAIDPKLEGGKKRAWLLVTGFSSANIIAVKVDL